MSAGDEPHRRTSNAPVIAIAPDIEALVTATAATLRAALARCIAQQGFAWFALAGGRTPRAVYERLALPGEPAIDWTRVRIAFGDERMVPPEHADSNYGMARAALLDHVPIAPGLILRIRGEMRSAEAAAEIYAEQLDDTFRLPLGTRPVFEVVLLGLGADGHTASLFAGTRALYEEHRLAMAVEAPSAPVHRVTLTYPVLNSAREVVILTAGVDKADAVARALAPEGSVETCPVRGIRPDAGRVTWHLDAAAASKLPAT